MPFKTSEEGTTWSPPSDEDVVEVQKKIYEQDTAKSGVDPDLTEELRSKIDEAVDSLVPGKGWGIIAHSNEKVYQTIEAITSGPRGLVDIIIPVYNSIHIVNQCIKSVVERTRWPYHIYIVDDASDQKTKDDLDKLQKSRPNDITILTNNKNKGFAASVNRGIREGNGEFVVLLNSDVIVTPLWLTKMLMAHKADPRNQIVCPATNNTAIVQVPLSPGASYLQMNRIFEAFAVRRYPEIMPTGFCFLFPRELINKIGYFDEGFANFGEESDFWMKALHYVDGDKYPRYRAVMADDTYVFHERGSSFSQLGADTHMHLRKLASGRFNEIWPQFGGWQKSYNVNKALGHLRDDVPAPLIGQNGKYHICWVEHSSAMCGGMKYISDVVNSINESGGNARVALIKRAPESDTSYLGELRTAPVVFESYEDFLTNFNVKVFKKGVAVAATAELAGVVRTLHDNNPKIKPVLHVQSYEPEIIPEAQEDIKNHIKKAFQLIPDVISNSAWVSKTLEKELNVKPFITIPPGVDQELFYPRNRENGDERPTVMIPMMPAMPCKGFDRGLTLIQEIEAQARSHGLHIRIMVYGTKSLPNVNNAICLGPLSQTRIANLLGSEVDVFVDPSTLQSYGMPALEAVASGVAVAGWDNKGIREYLDDNSAEILPLAEHPSKLASKVVELLGDPTKRTTLVNEANKVLPDHNRSKSIEDFTQAIEKQLNLTIKPRKIVVVVPHLRKHGGPTTMLNLANELAKHGHDVSVSTVYTDINPEVAAMTDLPIGVDAQAIPKCDIVITNSDNPMCDAISKMRHVKKKIMLKLSHNARFKQLEEQGLQCKWDAIVTSTQWLKDVCKNPGDWNYEPVEADRIGWWHYSHELMASNPRTRNYNNGSAEKPLTIGTLIHQHPSKGSQDAILALGNIFRTYTDRHIKFIGIGEIEPSKFGINLPNFRYKYAPNRSDMADILG